MPLLELKQVSKRYKQADADVVVLDRANFKLEQGRSAALLGESGSGKSTLLHLIAGLDKPDSGQINFENNALIDFSAGQWNQFRREKVSLVFQQYHLVSTLTVLDNIALQARMCGKLDSDFLNHLTNRLSLVPLLTRLPHQLSGGQQQRVAIARALLHKPALVLADEPTGNLDENTSRAVMDLLVDLVSDAGSSLLMVTHSSVMANFLHEEWHIHNGALTQTRSEK